MSKLFEDSDSDIDIKTDNTYAKSYDTWRKKEELNKFKARHGEHALELNDDEDEDSSEDDETGVELTKEVEKDFYKTLALLKNKDPKIYDHKSIFFQDTKEIRIPHSKTKKEKKLFLKDYERELLLDKGGIVSDSDNEDMKMNGNFMMEDENKLKQSFKVLDDEDDEDIGDLLRARQQTKEEEGKKEEDYKAWLVGQEKKLKDKETASSLKPLKDYWNNVKLDEGEKFLRDYFLNSRYLETKNKDYIPTYNEIVQDLSEDENEIEKQEEFEHKYNFRFEEPDQEFIKKYPRTIEGSLRREDNRRKVKRQETKERKAREKEEKMEELRKLRDIKRKEIEEKIEKLKEITGNKEIAFNDEDIEGDFDPEAHDRRMQALFNDEYYKDGQEEDTKPPIDLDDEDASELLPENYDNWTGIKELEEGNEPHCEDDTFNMDADYDPKATQKELVDSSRKKRKRKRKSKFLEMLAKERPKFDPLDKNYEKYVDEYYKFDCEDIIDDIPFKFKYRSVAPNSFGLSVEEILLAKDRELNKWCSLKKAVALRDEQVEKYEQIAYAKKGENISLKKKVIPSLFEEESPSNENKNSKSAEMKKRKEETNEGQNSTVDSLESFKKKKNCPTQENGTKKDDNTTEKGDEKPKKKKGKKIKSEKPEQLEPQCSDEATCNENLEDILSSTDNVSEEVLNTPLGHSEDIPKKKRKQHKEVAYYSAENQEKTSILQNVGKISKKKKNRGTENKTSSAVKRKFSVSDQQNSAKKFKKNKMKNGKPEDIGISDARITCYGWNPKKFKNKLIYGNKNQNQ